MQKSAAQPEDAPMREKRNRQGRHGKGAPAAKWPLRLRRGDLFLLGGLLLAALALLGGAALFSKEGGRALLTTLQGERELSLSQDEVVEIDGSGGIHVVIRVQDGAVWFESSGCPDQICVHSGRLSRTGDTAACLPAGVVVLVTQEAAGQEGSPPADAVAG
ncbi:MAG TPA: NusG domain II-containing protein [Firmicutes bacterium]|nr:NusG domain II-containing protein [Bacillota bacterium]